MKIYVAQIYIEPGIAFPFTHHFQQYISQRLTELIEPSPKFIVTFGGEFDLIFRMSAKAALVEPEIQGPTVFKRDRDVEYTVFLPFHKPSTVNQQFLEAGVGQLLAAIAEVLSELGFDVARLRQETNKIIAAIVRDSRMTGLGPSN
jgi:hypothetical protein